MKRGSARLLAVAGLALAVAARAEWRFDAAVDVTPAASGAFHHLEASGRAALAVSGGRVAVVWEDSRTGRPTCYLGIRDGAGAFRELAYGHGECYAPAVAALPDGRFALIWEDETGVNAALAGPAGIGSVRNLSAQGGQGHLARHPRLGLHAAWSSPDGRWRRVFRARLEAGAEGGLRASEARPADPAPARDDQMYPVLAATDSALTLAWEDRRHGHTVIHASVSHDGQAWSPPLRVSRNPTGRINGDLGRGTGAMRPALAALGGDRLAAVWLDKRDFLSGYDVYAALSPDGGASFGPDLKVQDSFGDAIAQWHAAAAGNGRGALAVAWDDERDGTPDVWLSWLTPAGAFADNVAPPPASGPGAQTDPAIALDEAGNLHLAWVERVDERTSRVRYALGGKIP
ncbi:MAG: hypothetical protein MUC79_01925 [Thiobacillaceae bacterium]|jgi:hypothetical protein|nr:hypothetical protein [Thiobacillaceae bacterium]